MANFSLDALVVIAAGVPKFFSGSSGGILMLAQLLVVTSLTALGLAWQSRRGGRRFL